MTTMTVSSDADRVKILDNVISSVGRASSGFNSIKQLVENALDAGATRIDILVDKKKKLFRVADNGSGFTDEDIRSFYSFMVSGKDGLSSIGKNGSGRMALLSMCDYIVVHTKTEDQEEVKTFQLGRQHLINSFDGVQEVEFDMSSEEIDSHGTIIELGGKIKWTKAKTEDALRGRLPYLLMPGALRKIWINGKPLTSNSILEQPIEGVDEIPGLGRCSYELHIIPGTTERIWLCGQQNRIMRLEDALNQLPTELRDVVPELVTHNNLTGVIQIELLNAYRGHDDTLTPRFYDEHSRSLVRFLRGDFLDKIKEAIPQGDDQQLPLTTTFMENLLLKLPSRGGKRSGTIHTPNSIVSESSYTLEPGDKLPLRNSLKLDWEWDGDEGGDITQDGGRTILTAGTEGSFVLLGYTADILRKRIRLKIVDSIDMSIMPSRSSMEPSGSKELTVTHFSGDKTDLKVSVDGENVRAKLIGRKVTVVTENATVGAEITVTVKDGEGNKAQSVIKVEESLAAQSDSIMIDDQTYLVKFASAFQQVVVNCVTEGGKPCMRIKFTHPLIGCCSDPTTLLWSSIFRSHVWYVNESQDLGMTPRQMDLKVEELMMNVMN